MDMKKRIPQDIYEKRIESIDEQLTNLKKTDFILAGLKLLFVVCCVYLLFKVVLDYSSFVLSLFIFFLVILIVTAVIHGISW